MELTPTRNTNTEHHRRRQGHGHSICVATTKESEHVGFKNSRKKDKENFRVVFAWGDNSRGQLGFGFNADADPIKFMNKSKVFGENCTLRPTVAVGVSEVFTEVEGLIPERVAAGKFFSAVVTARTTVMTFGDNDYGQLGQGDLVGVGEEGLGAGERETGRRN